MRRSFFKLFENRNPYIHSSVLVKNRDQIEQRKNKRNEKYWYLLYMMVPGLYISYATVKDLSSK